MGTLTSFADTLAALRDRGLRVHRGSGGSLEVVGDGELDDALADQVGVHRDDFDRLLPDPAAEASRLWEQGLDECNSITPITWFPSADDWEQLDVIEDAFEREKVAGNLDDVRQACDDYRDELQRQLTVDEIHQWTDDCPRCDFDRTDDQLICSPCRDLLKEQVQQEREKLPPCTEGSTE